jgi:ribokinase
VGANGANQIIVASGANAHVNASQVSDAQLRASRMLLMQMELPLDETVKMLRRARAAGVRTVVNNAPTTALSAEMLRMTDVLIVNEHEFADTLRHIGAPAPTAEGFSQGLEGLAKVSGGTVIVTLGKQGALASHAGQLLRVAAPQVEVIDTTGAGDTFCGALCAALLRGEDMEMAMHSASQAATLACTWLGAQKPTV